MTVLTTAASVTVQGNNATTVFNFGFEIPYQADGITPAVAVWFYDTASPNTPPVQLAVNLYTIANVGNPAGGTITYPLVGPPMTTTQSLTIKRALLEVQGTAVPNNSFFPNVVENVGDTEMMVIQQLQEQLNRAILLSPIDAAPPVVPPPLARENTVIGFGSNGVFTLYPITGSGLIFAPYLLVTTAVNYVALGTESVIEVNAAAGLVQVTILPASFNGRSPVRVRKTDTSNNLVTVFDGTTIVDSIRTAAQVEGGSLKVNGWRDVSAAGGALRSEGIG